MRARWLKATRASAPRSSGDHVVVAATITAEPLLPYLGVRFVDEGLGVPRITVAPYDQIFQVCLNWKAMFTDPAPTAIVILWRIEDLLRSELHDFLLGKSDALESAYRKLEDLRAAVATLRQSFQGAIVVSVPPFPHGPAYDIRAARTVLGAGLFHRRVIDRWVEGVAEVSGLSFLDLDGSQRYVGIEQSDDARKWYLYRQPYTEAFWNQLASDLFQALRRQKTASKKCLVVDCDNTLWGGIVGEDGLEGIKLGEDFPGSAFRDFQRQLLILKSRGVMLAICSKNNEPDVWEVFERHDGMVVRREDFVAARINWLDKPSNIQSIAKELNIGVDSLVFVDDSPIEIERVRNDLPVVECIQVPEDAARFLQHFNAVRLFDREEISDEDRVRSEMMIQERDRQALGVSLNADEFAQALRLVVDFFEIQDEHVARVTQLIGKTNQFNLTTRRRTAGEVAAVRASPDWKVFAWRVGDRFGDYGLVGVVITERINDVVVLDTLLMSCRVLGRGVESAVFAALADYARSVGASRLRGQYIPSAKNKLVADLYRSNGFSSMSDGYWECADLARYRWPEHITRQGL
jgi:FkbH-like protein